MSTLTITPPASAHRTQMVTQAVIAAYVEELVGRRRRARARVRPARIRDAGSGHGPALTGRLSQAGRRVR